MGKGNAQKTAAARARNQASAEAEGKGGGGAAGMQARAGTLAIICQVCRTGFMASQSRAQLQAHVDSKHAKTHNYDSCFPDCKDKCVPAEKAMASARDGANHRFSVRRFTYPLRPSSQGINHITRAR